MNCAALLTSRPLFDLVMAFASVCFLIVVAAMAVAIALSAWADFRKPRGGN